MITKLLTIDKIVSAWTGHANFAMWLVEQMRPTTTVDLGVDYGYSTFCFATRGIGTVYGIDWFNGDPQTGVRNTYSQVLESKAEGGFDNVELIQGKFDEVAKIWQLPIDILHIDGLHEYEAVKNDYETWSPFVRDGGIILMHYTESYPNDVGRLFNEIDLPKLNMKNSAGLGIVSKDEALLEKIKETFGHLL